MLRTVNIILVLSFLVQCTTVFLMVVFKNFSLQELHELNGLLLLALVFVHVALNFTWIKRNILGIKQ
jgi:hypothetical protein